MIVIMKPTATEREVEKVIERMIEDGFDIHRSTGAERTVLGAVGVAPDFDRSSYRLLDGVEEVVRVSTPYKRVSRSFHPDDLLIRVGDVVFGGDEVVVLAGPCSVESEDQIHRIAGEVAQAGARVLRGGAFNPRSSPYGFQGLGEEGLGFLRNAADAHGLAVCTEVMDPSHIELVDRYADILQVGARNMQNYVLLTELGRLDKPVLLKRGAAATLEEWLLAAEYIADSGNGRILLCERGIRTFETATRNTMDISAVPVTQDLSPLPVIADPSHGIGVRKMVPAMARAAVAAGADGLLVEVHHDADHALSDAAQTLYPDQFQRLMDELRIIVPAVGREI